MKTFDRSIINSYLIRKYGRKVVNMLGRTLEEENELIRKSGESKFMGLLPVGDYLEQWEHHLPRYLEYGLDMSIVQNMRDER